MINANEYDNGTTIFTTSSATAGRFQREIETGQVGIDVPIPVPLPCFSFIGTRKVLLVGVQTHFMVSQA